MQSIPPQDPPDVAWYKAVVHSGKLWSDYSQAEKDLANAVDRKYPNLIATPASSVAMSTASYHNSSYSSISGISMGGVSQATIQSPSDLTNEQLEDAFNRTRRQYLHERGGQNITAHSSRQARSSPSINEPCRTPRHYRSARATRRHAPPDPLESIKRRQDELIAKRNTLAEEICQRLHQAVDLEFNMGQCDSQLAELKMEEDGITEGLVSGTDLMRDGVQGATWDWWDWFLPEQRKRHEKIKERARRRTAREDREDERA